ncbi:jg23397 [Pararge aegeria aegeria]|uniref:Jg23397 protein n=1 Tax=Pararge aegeria aegeria TaxID=348720 RepID=A0A8S4RK46_9NEOP|nr:jg23397 [Pararge aegeria aegeria]
MKSVELELPNSSTSRKIEVAMYGAHSSENRWTLGFQGVGVTTPHRVVNFSIRNIEEAESFIQNHIHYLDSLSVQCEEKETAYFWRWWKEQRGATRATFKSLVAEGRIQFAGGGWVQADEATADYLQLLDHYTWGHRKLNDTLGPCGKPKAAWQIDTYGHTREHASLLAQMGFDGLFIGRVDHKEREAMIEEDRLEFMWRGSDVLGKMSDIMTHTLYNLYNAPDGFCFDFLCSDEPIIDDPDTKAYNADKRVNDFISQIERQAKYYEHDNIMVTMGGDFTYQSAAHWFMNIDKLINHVNSHPADMSDINIFYSTPSCYLKAIYLYGRRDKAVHTEKIVKQLTVLSRMADSYELHLLRHAVSLVLHHDAITAPEDPNVHRFFDLCALPIATSASRLAEHSSKSRSSSNLLIADLIMWRYSSHCSLYRPLSDSEPSYEAHSKRPRFRSVYMNKENLNFEFELVATEAGNWNNLVGVPDKRYLNIACPCSQFAEGQESILLLVYNPLSVKTYHHVRLPAIALHYSIRDFNDEEVEYQMVPLPTAVINLPGRSSTAIQELCFEAENIPPLGFTSYYIEPIRDQLAEGQLVKKSKQNPDAEHETSYISNEVAEKASYHSIRGSLVKEIRQRFSDWVTQIIRLYRGEEFVEIEWIVGPVPIGTDLGKEVVSIFKTNISNNGVFFTDSNSRQMMKRSCWNESTSQQQKKHLPACFYPVSSRICLQSWNSSVDLCVLTDRVQGGTSYNEGEVELMIPNFQIHRRLLTDDGFSLEESLNEEAFGVGLVVKGKHRIFFGNFKQDVDDQTFPERATQMSRKWTYEPWLFMTPGEKISRRKWQNVRNKRKSITSLISSLTTDPRKQESQVQDEINKSSHITVELRKIFIQFKIRMVRETTLAANQWLEDARQMDWSTRYVYSGGDDGIFPEDNPDYPDEIKVTKPMDIKESALHSDEDDYTRKKVYRHTNRRYDKPYKIKSTHEFESRRKRSINITDNITDVKNTTKGKQEINKNIDGEPQIKNTKWSRSDTVIDFENITSRPKIFKNRSRHHTTTPKLSFLSVKMNPSNLFVDLNKSEDIPSSEEDVSSNIKKHSSKKRINRPKIFKDYDDADLYQDDTDDGITKSMYDMYYKSYRSKPRKTAFKPHLRSSEMDTEHSRKRRKSGRANDDSSETTSRRSKHKRRKGPSIGIPFFITNSRLDEERAEVSHKSRKYYPEKIEPTQERHVLTTGREDGARPVTPRNKRRRDYTEGSQEEQGSLEEEMENEEEDKPESRYSRRSKRYDHH